MKIVQMVKDLFQRNKITYKCIATKKIGTSDERRDIVLVAEHTIEKYVGAKLVSTEPYFEVMKLYSTRYIAKDGVEHKRYSEIGDAIDKYENFLYEEEQKNSYRKLIEASKETK